MDINLILVILLVFYVFVASFNFNGFYLFIKHIKFTLQSHNNVYGL